MFRGSVIVLYYTKLCQPTEDKIPRVKVVLISWEKLQPAVSTLRVQAHSAAQALTWWLCLFSWHLGMYNITFLLFRKDDVGLN